MDVNRIASISGADEGILMSGGTYFSGLTRILLTQTLRVNTRVFLLLVIILSANRVLSQEIHIIPQTEPLVERNSIREPVDRSTFKVSVDLVLVSVTVTDFRGRLIAGLDKENFMIYENKEKQAIKHFSSEDSPVSLGIIFDTSSSMKDKVEYARKAVIEFLKAANPQDEFFVITFANKPEVAADFTNSVENIQNRLAYAVPKGYTALLDAIYLGISKMRQAKYAKKALLVISDGGDNHSRYTEREIKSLVRETDTIVYAIGIYDHYFSTIEEQTGPMLLSKVSKETGGRAFTIDNANDSIDVATEIGHELRNQYMLGYHPLNPKNDGKWHKIKVKLSPPQGFPRLDVRAKQGYYAPSE
jgi:Ca-activated chloride channel family protein